MTFHQNWPHVSSSFFYFASALILMLNIDLTQREAKEKKKAATAMLGFLMEKRDVILSSAITESSNLGLRELTYFGLPRPIFNYI